MKEKANAEKVEKQPNYKAVIGGEAKRFLGSMLCFLYIHIHTFICILNQHLVVLQQFKVSLY